MQYAYDNVMPIILCNSNRIILPLNNKEIIYIIISGSEIQKII